MALEQPKKPVGGAYGVFMTEKRPEFAKACEGKPVSAVVQMASKAWKELSDAEKKPYEEKYVTAKAKFEEDMAAFLEAGGEKAKTVRKDKKEKTKAVKDPNKPKKPAGGAYAVFLAENRAKITESLPAGSNPITDVAKVAGAQWKALSEAQRQPYEATFAKKTEEYKKAMEEYTPPAPEVPDVVESEKKTPSKKRALPERSTPSPAAKAKKVSKKSSASKEVEIDANVLKEAENLKLVAQIKNLLGRPEIVSSGKSHKEMLDALKNSDGLVNKAKAALLGA